MLVEMKKMFDIEENSIEGLFKKNWFLYVILFVVGAVLFVSTFTGVVGNIPLAERIMFGYCFGLLFSVLLWTVGFTVYAEKQERYRAGRLKRFIYWVLSVLVIVFFLPMFVVEFLIKKSRLSISEQTFPVYLTLSGITIVSLLMGLYIADYAIINKFEIKVLSVSFNPIAVIIGITLILVWALNRFVLWIFYKTNKSIGDEEKKNIKEDLYIFFLLAITVCTIVLNLVNLSSSTETLVKTLNGVFAIYLAVDRLVTKYKAIKVESGK